MIQYSKDCAMDPGFKIYLVNTGMTKKSQLRMYRAVQRIISHCDPLTPETFAKFESELLETLSNSAVNKYIRALNHYLKYKQMESFGVKVLKEASKPKITLSSTEIQQIIAARDNRHSQIIRLLAYTGCRTSEIINNLKAEDISISEKIIYIQESKTGEGRIIPINDSIYDLCVELSRGSGVLFKVSNTALNKELSKRAVDCGIKKHVTSYVFRHSFITRMLAAGIPLFVVQSIVGHKRAETTRQYFHQNRKMLLDAIRSDPLNLDLLTPEKSSCNL